MAALTEPSALVDSRQRGEQVEIQRETGEFEPSSVEMGRVRR